MAQKPYYAYIEPDALSGVRGRMVELFLNKEYRGIYCLMECMDRKQMKLKKVDKQTGEIHGALYKSEGYGASMMYSYSSTYDNKSETWDTFEVKYPELDDAEETDWSTLWNAINFVATSSDADFRNHVADYFDIPVLIDYYVFLNVLNACDNVGKNMFWAVYDKAQDKKLTPAVWDLDLTTGSKMLDYYLPGTAGIYSPEYEMPINIKLFSRLKNLNVDQFKNKAIKRYHELRNDVLSTDRMISRYTDYFDQIYLSGAASREEDKWSEDSDVKGEVINFENEIYYISYWLARHLTYLEEHQFKNIDEPTTYIQSVAPTKTSAHTYNLYGQKIGESYRGIYIKDGKKYIAK